MRADDSPGDSSSLGQAVNPSGLGAKLLRYLAATSEEWARLIGKLVGRNPRMAGVLMDLEADDDHLRARFEIELLRTE